MMPAHWNYVIAAYGITYVTLVAYGLRLFVHVQRLKKAAQTLRNR